MGTGEDELSLILAGADELALGTIVRLEAALGFRLDGGFGHRELPQRHAGQPMDGGARWASEGSTT